MTNTSLTRVLTIITLLGATQPMVAHAAPQDYQLDYSHSRLSKGLGDWNDTRFYWQRNNESQSNWHAQIENWNRFGQTDTNLGIGRKFFISNQLKITAELNFSDTNSLFPAYSLYGGLETKLTPVTVFTAGLKYSHYRKQDPITQSYNEPDSETLNGRVEYYFGDSMLAYSLFYTMMQTNTLSDSVVSQSVKYLYSYQLRNSVFVSIDSGGDVDYEPTSSHLSVAQIDSVSLGGNHWLSDELGLIYTVGTHQVAVSGSGFNYKRNVIYIGLRKHTH